MQSANKNFQRTKIARLAALTLIFSVVHRSEHSKINLRKLNGRNIDFALLYNFSCPVHFERPRDVAFL